MAEIGDAGQDRPADLEQGERESLEYRKAQSARVEGTPHSVFLSGIPAGFVLATIAWLLPNARGQEIGS